ncbi:MAG: hypothetical protein PHU25_01110 [Deltaproteobacteria bacterium]|nr:hypothetical protein [Deltaproteobacteria bacterium]
MKITFLFTAVIVPCALGLVACGSSAPKAQTAEDDGNLASILCEKGEDCSALEGKAEIKDEDTTKPAPVEEAYTGPTKLTVNLKVVDHKNPEGSYRVLKADGTAALENGKFGETVEVPQGLYNIEFKTKAVFGEPTYTAEDIEVTGKEKKVDEIFPAGETLLHTYLNKKDGPCVKKSFTVKSETLNKELPGKGKTCEPVVLETGRYEILLDMGKKAGKTVVKPVSIMVNAEQKQSAPVNLGD